MIGSEGAAGRGSVWGPFHQRPGPWAAGVPSPILQKRCKPEARGREERARRGVEKEGGKKKAEEEPVKEEEGRREGGQRGGRGRSRVRTGEEKEQVGHRRGSQADKSNPRATPELLPTPFTPQTKQKQKLSTQQSPFGPYNYLVMKTDKTGQTLQGAHRAWLLPDCNFLSRPHPTF